MTDQSYKLISCPLIISRDNLVIFCVFLQEAGLNFHALNHNVKELFVFDKQFSFQFDILVFDSLDRCILGFLGESKDILF